MALAGWTLGVLLLVPYHRFRAGAAGQITPDDFKYGESARVPVQVSIPNRNLMNLLELPLLFYFFSLLAFVANAVDQAGLYLAWLYVALRVLHSLIHLSYNHVLQRALVFALSNAVLGVIWLRLLIAICA